MTRTLLLTAAYLLLIMPTHAAESPDDVAIQLTAENYQSWREHILPCEAELEFSKLPWEVTFADGLAAAAEQNKPLFLWTMNGHPLGCT